MVDRLLTGGGTILKKSTLTDSEWKIMKLLWRQSPLTMRNIEDSLKTETGWSKHTIISFLKRMLAKGAISAKDAKPVKLYYQIWKEQQMIDRETRSMLGKLYDGQLSLMVSNLISQQELSEEEINELMEILRQGKGSGK